MSEEEIREHLLLALNGEFTFLSKNELEVLLIQLQMVRDGAKVRRRMRPAPGADFDKLEFEEPHYG